MKTYTGEFREEGDVWIAEVREVPQAHTFGRTLPRAMALLRDALALYLDVEPETFKIKPEVHLDAPGASEALEAALLARDEEERAKQAAKTTVPTAARQLIDVGYSYRAAAVMLGLSHQRVQQMVTGATGAARNAQATTRAGKSAGRVLRNPKSDRAASTSKTATKRTGGSRAIKAS